HGDATQAQRLGLLLLHVIPVQGHGAAGGSGQEFLQGFISSPGGPVVPVVQQGVEVARRRAVAGLQRLEGETRPGAWFHGQGKVNGGGGEVSYYHRRLPRRGGGGDHSAGREPAAETPGRGEWPPPPRLYGDLQKTPPRPSPLC